MFTKIKKAMGLAIKAAPLVEEKISNTVIRPVITELKDATIVQINSDSEFILINKTAKFATYAVAKQNVSQSIKVVSTIETTSDSKGWWHKVWNRFEEANEKGKTLLDMGNTGVKLGGVAVAGAGLYSIHKDANLSQECPSLGKLGLRRTKSESDLISTKSSSNCSSRSSSFDSSYEID
jgi:hypothetical protein